MTLTPAEMAVVIAALVGTIRLLIAYDRRTEDQRYMDRLARRNR